MITEILKTALGSYDLSVVPGALAECSESPIAEEKIEPASTYDHESRHYHYRARAYDPTMGRFLQTDPLGYQDSMNLYQAFNMNPFNFTDPMGDTTVNINIERFKMVSKSTIGRFTVSLDDMFDGTSDFVNNFIQGYQLFTRAKGINLFTLEKPWVENKRNDSCVPIGEYETDITWSPKFQQKLPELQDVPGNRNYDANGNYQPIRIHRGNWPSDIQGCILVGTNYNPGQNENEILHSTTAVTQLMNLIKDVKNFDSKRNKKTKMNTNITMNLIEMYQNFKNSIQTSNNKIGDTCRFLWNMSEMANNDATILREQENLANTFFGNMLPKGYVFIQSVLGDWAVQRRK
jgi:RHS repeat-associated protein